MNLNTETLKIISSQNYNETHCKNCGRYIGAVEICPFCRTYNPKRLVVRLIKYLSPIIALLGIFVLYYIGIYFGNPKVSLASLTKRSNFAQVNIEGEICSPIKYYPSQTNLEDSYGTLEFEIDDGSAIMLVRCYEDVTRELVQSKKIPAFKDKVNLTASFQYKGKGSFLILGSEANLKIDREIPQSITLLNQIFENNIEVGKRIKVEGIVKNITRRKYELAIDISSNETSENKLSLIIPLSTLLVEKIIKDNLDELTNLPQINDKITATGILDLRGKRNNQYYVLMITSYKDIIKLAD